MVKFIRRKATGAAVTVGVLIALIFLAKRFGVGGQLIEAGGH